MRLRATLRHAAFSLAVFAGGCISAQQTTVPVELKQHLDKAQALLEQEKYPDMVAELEAAIAIWPQLRGAYYQLGFGLFQLGQSAAAEAAFLKELKFDPPDPYSLYYLGRIRLEANQRQKALDLFEKSLAAGEVLDVRQRIASAYLSLGRTNDAVKFLQASVRARPDNGGLHYLLGRAYKEQKQSKKALEEFAAAARWKEKTSKQMQSLAALREAIAAKDATQLAVLPKQLIETNDIDILIAAATTLGDAGLHEQALPLLTKIIKLQPKLPEAHYNLARAHLALGQDSLVEPELKTSIELRPDFYEAHVLLGTLLANGGESERAIKHLRAAAALPGATPRMLTMLGLQYYEQRYFADAVEVLTRAVRLEPNDPDPRFLLVQAHYRNLEYEQALAVAQETKQLFPDLPLAHYHVAAQLNNFGRFAEAKPELEAALAKDEKLLEARVMLGEVLVKLGHTEESLSEFRRALAIDPKWIEAHAGLGKALIQLRRFPEAAAAMEQAVRIDENMPSIHLYLSQAYRGLGRIEDAKREAEIFGRLNEQRARRRDTDVERKYPSPPGS